MAYRGISKITLLKRGIVICTDDQGRQSPPLQGLYRDVIDDIRKSIGPDDVSWVIFGVDNPVSFVEWCRAGEKESGDVSTIPVDDDIMGEMMMSPPISDD